MTSFATFLPRWLPRHSVLALAGIGLACAAQQSTAAARPVPAESASRATAPVKPRAITAANADRVQRVWEATPGGTGTAVAASRALGRVAYSNGQGVLFYDLATGKATDAGVETCSPVVRSGLNYIDRQLVVVCAGAVKVRDGAKTATRDLSIAPEPVTAAAVSRERVALAHRDGVIRLYPLDGGAPLEIPVPGPPIDVKSLALTADGQRMAVAWVQGSIWWWDIAAPAAPHPLVRHERESDTVAFSRDGATFAEEGEAFYTSVWSFQGLPTTTTRLRNGAWVKRLHFTHDGAWLVRGGSDGLELAEIAGPRRVVLDDRGSVEDVALSEDGGTLAAVDRTGRLAVYTVR